MRIVRLSNYSLAASASSLTFIKESPIHVFLSDVLTM